MKRAVEGTQPAMSRRASTVVAPTTSHLADGRIAEELGEGAVTQEFGESLIDELCAGGGTELASFQLDHMLGIGAKPCRRTFEGMRFEAAGLIRSSSRETSRAFRASNRLTCGDGTVPDGRAAAGPDGRSGNMVLDPREKRTMRP